jgi:hypothetical protein
LASQNPAAFIGFVRDVDFDHAGAADNLVREGDGPVKVVQRDIRRVEKTFDAPNEAAACVAAGRRATRCAAVSMAKLTADSVRIEGVHV